MRIVFRADATPQIGAGHVMRLSAIAEEAIQRGIECFFVGHIREIQWLDEYVHSVGYHQVLNPKSISSVMSKQTVLMIDSYEIPVSEPYLDPIGWNLIVSITDALTPSYYSNLVVAPGISSHRLNHKGSNVLSGPMYIPFRKSISRSVKVNPTTNPRLLIFGGGTDQFGMAPKIAQLIRQKYDYSEANFLYHESFEIESMDPRFKVFPFGPALESIINQSDVVITSASTSSFEVLARGIPVGVVRLVGNQDENYRDLGKAGLVLRIGNRSDDGSWIFSIAELERLLLDSEHRDGLSRKNSTVFDFLGSSRILDEVSRRYLEIS
jgi:spore coat polysaccharide biosynthesis predicted glycosyltransferase SpsG